MFYCYKITNLSNGKVYIGKTKNVKSRWAAHKSRALNVKDSRFNYPLSNAIRKYGVDNFVFEVIQSCETELEINFYEEYFISLFKSNINIYGKSFGYNLTNGGEKNAGGKLTEETRLKMSKSHQGLLHSEDSKNKIGKAHIGMRHSKEVKVILSNAFSGEKSCTAKLTWEIVIKIREEYKNTNITQKQLSEKYGVSVSNINSIVCNKSWRV